MITLVNVMFCVMFVLFAIAVISGFQLLGKLKKHAHFEWKEIIRMHFFYIRSLLPGYSFDGTTIKCAATLMAVAVWMSMGASMVALSLQFIDFLNMQWIDFGVQFEFHWIFSQIGINIAIIALHAAGAAFVQNKEKLFSS